MKRILALGLLLGFLAPGLWAQQGSQSVPNAIASTTGGTLGGTFAGGPTFTIAAGAAGATESGSVVTISTAPTVCTITLGMTVNIVGVGVAGYNGNFVAATSCSGGTSFTYGASITGLAASGGGTVTGSPILNGNANVPGLLSTGGATPAFADTPIALSNTCGLAGVYITTFPNAGHNPCAYSSLQWGAPATPGSGFQGFSHYTQLITKSGIDVQSSVSLFGATNCFGTNSGGTDAGDTTTCLAGAAYATESSTTASANVVGFSAQGQSSFTGLGAHLVQGAQQLVKTARCAGWFGDTVCDYVPVVTNVIQVGSQNATAGFGMSSSTAGKGFLFGEYVVDSINAGHAVLHGTIAAPDTGYWCATSITQCHFIGAGGGYSTNYGNLPRYSDSPTWGTVYGEKAANSGQSNVETFFSTNAGTVCTPLASPNGASEVGNTITITCNAAISGDFAGANVSVAHITGMGVTGYNIDCPIVTVASPSFTCIDSNIVTASFTVTGLSESGSTVTVTTSATCPFTTGENATMANAANAAPSTNNGYNGTFVVLTPGCNGGSTYTYTDTVTGLATCASQVACAQSPAAAATVIGNPLPASGGGSVTASTRQAFTSWMASNAIHHFGYASPPSGNGTDKFLWDMVNGRLGIGTVAPLTVFDVQKSGTQVVRTCETTVPTCAEMVSANGAAQFGSGTNHRVDVLVNGAATWSVSTAGVLGPLTDGNNDLGAVGSLRPNNAFIKLNARASGHYSDLGVACTNGELALSAGWQSTGSATVTAVQGIGQTCMWTITTGTTTAANPTITDTLTNALPAATIICEMNIHGGTGAATFAADGPILQTSLSTTAPIFTFQGTPAAGGLTYFVTRRCGP